MKMLPALTRFVMIVQEAQRHLTANPVNQFSARRMNTYIKLYASPAPPDDFALQETRQMKAILNAKLKSVHASMEPEPKEQCVPTTAMRSVQAALTGITRLTTPSDATSRSAHASMEPKPPEQLVLTTTVRCVSAANRPSN
jgi:hypothetical protein